LYISLFYSKKDSALSQMSKASALVSLFLSIVLLTQYFNNYQITWVGYLFYSLACTCMVHLAGVIVTTSLGPVAAGQFDVANVMWKYEVFFLYVQPLALLVCLLICTAVYGSTSVALGQQQAMGSFVMIYGIFQICFAPVVFRYTTTLLKALNSSIKVNPQNRLVKVHAKVKLLRLTICSASLSGGLGLALSGGVIFANHTLPWGYLLQFIIMVVVPLSMVQIAHYTIPSSNNGISSSNPNIPLSTSVMM
jgi:hypothetical protein